MFACLVLRHVEQDLVTTATFQIYHSISDQYKFWDHSIQFLPKSQQLSIRFRETFGEPRHGQHSYWKPWPQWPQGLTTTRHLLAVAKCCHSQSDRKWHDGTLMQRKGLFYVRVAQLSWLYYLRFDDATGLGSPLSMESSLIMSNGQDLGVFRAKAAIVRHEKRLIGLMVFIWHFMWHHMAPLRHVSCAFFKKLQGFFLDK